MLDQNINTWLEQKPERRMIRVLDGKVRAFLADRYRRLDNLELCAAVLPVIQEMQGSQIESCEVTPTHLYIKVVNRRVKAEVKVGDIVQAGFVVSNSEVGLGSLRVEPLVDEAKFMLTVDKLREATQIPLKHDPVKAVELLADKFQLTENERGDILRQLFMGADNSRYGLVNAVTAASKIAKSYERATDLERIGGEILSLPVPRNMLPPPSYNVNLAIPEYETISA